MLELFHLQPQIDETDGKTPDGKIKHHKIDRAQQANRSWFWQQKHANDILSPTPVEDTPVEPKPNWWEN